MKPPSPTPMLTWLSRDNLDFPALHLALSEPNGLLAAGGDLAPERIVSAYRHGCFPWYQAGQPILWWSPDPRTVLEPKHIHLPRSLRKVMRQAPYQVTYDRDFEAVIGACAEPRNYTSDTWITEEMKRSYTALHEQGVAHSVEVWEDGHLIGGLYGLAIGKLFFGESMFSRADNASKVGFATLARDLERWGFVLIDCQMPTEHLANFGAHGISRQAFSQYLETFINEPVAANWCHLEG